MKRLSILTLTMVALADRDGEYEWGTWHDKTKLIPEL
jgi:hypothetical protein